MLRQNLDHAPATPNMTAEICIIHATLRNKSGAVHIQYHDYATVMLSEKHHIQLTALFSS